MAKRSQAAQLLDEDDQPIQDGGSTPPDDAGFDNPLHEAREAGADELPEPDIEPPRSAACDGTAQILTQLVDIGCTVRWRSPLAPDECAELQRDLAAVLVKHDVPDVPYAEEIKLTATLGGIVFRRAAAARAAAAEAPPEPPITETPPPPPPENPSDINLHRQEGQRQNGFGAQTGSSRATSEIASILS